MFKSLHLAWSLIRIPHLALSLFVFPLIVSLALVFGQLIATGLVLKAMHHDSGELSTAARSAEDNNVVRLILYGDGKRRPPLKVCRWSLPLGARDEEPSGPECAPDRLDVAIQTATPEAIDTAPYEALFDGHVDRIHVCRSCRPDVVIDLLDRVHRSRTYSVFGLAILSLPFTNRSITEQKVSILRRVEEIKALLGDLFFYVPELPQGVGISEVRSSLPFAINITLLILIALWLALRAHRKVLDYFSHNNVLLPLVAACGKGRFYSALWVLTGLRVGCFLFASVPLMYFGLKDVAGDDAFSDLRVSYADVAVWLLALVSTLSLATLVASIAELKHRHSMLSFLYRYVPILLAVSGAAVWGGSFIVDSTTMSHLRATITILPVFGMAPVFIAPVLSMPKTMLLVHAGLSLILLAVALRYNARWFAAHLEEV